MGKRRKRLTMKKYAKKYGSKRAALYGTEETKEVATDNPEPTPTPVVEPTLSEPEVVVVTAPVEAPNALKEIKTNTTTTKTTKTTKKRRRRRKSSSKPATGKATKVATSKTSR